MIYRNPTKQQKEILDLLAVSEGRLLLKLNERRGSFGLFEGRQRIGEQLFHPSTVISAHEKGLVCGDSVHGYYLTVAGKSYLKRIRSG